MNHRNIAVILPFGGDLQMSVDMERRHDLPVFVDMTFPAVPCAGCILC